jgi:hypothetical protein
LTVTVESGNEHASNFDDVRNNNAESPNAINLLGVSDSPTFCRQSATEMMTFTAMNNPSVQSYTCREASL